MKPLLSLLAVLIAVNFSYAQWITTGTNTTTTNNVGIGTASPSSQLELRDGSGLSVIASNAKILLSDVVAGMYLRMDNSSNLQITNASQSPLVSFMQGGNVGIGTTSPGGKLHILNSYDLGNSTALKMFYQSSWGTAEYASNFRFLDIASTEGNKILELNGYGMGIGYEPPAYLSPDKLYVNGNVGIGTTTPDATLAVNGTIHSKEVKVDLAGWPDYVFKPQYNLPSLTDVKSYIDQNQHLPDMPSEQEVDKNGVNLGEMVKLQTKKIEELTLYLIEKEKELKEQEKRISALEKILMKPAQ